MIGEWICREKLAGRRGSDPSIKGGGHDGLGRVCDWERPGWVKSSFSRNSFCLAWLTELVTSNGKFVPCLVCVSSRQIIQGPSPASLSPNSLGPLLYVLRNRKGQVLRNWVIPVIQYQPKMLGYGAVLVHEINSFTLRSTCVLFWRLRKG